MKRSTPPNFDLDLLSIFDTITRCFQLSNFDIVPYIAVFVADLLEQPDTRLQSWILMPGQHFPLGNTLRSHILPHSIGM